MKCPTRTCFTTHCYSRPSGKRTKPTVTDHLDLPRSISAKPLRAGVSKKCKCCTGHRYRFFVIHRSCSWHWLAHPIDSNPFLCFTRFWGKSYFLQLASKLTADLDADAGYMLVSQSYACTKAIPLRHKLFRKTSTAGDAEQAACIS